MVMARSQTLVQLNDRLLAALDEVAARTSRSRSELIRSAIAAYLEQELSTDDDRRIVEAYRATPQLDDGWARASASAMIAQEPW